MVDINLLPWRDYQRVQENKRLKCILIMTGILMVGFMTIIHHVLMFQQRRLTSEIANLTAQHHAAAMHESLDRQPMMLSIDEMKIVQDDQLMIEKLFVKLGALAKYQICLTEISSNSNGIVFDGKARSTADLTAFLTQWDALYSFSEAKLAHLAKQEKNNWITFRLLAIK